MAVVELSFTPLAAHVGTARLIATAIARRAAVEPEVVDEIRLAVGEACSRAVRLHQSRGLVNAIRLTLSVDRGRYEVVVIDAVAVDEAPRSIDDVDLSHESDFADDGSLSPTIGLAVVVGLVDSVDVVSLPAGGTEVRMSWPSGEVVRDTVLAAEA
jgi:anti-sigma regulatory factor (Ser/Thr protein kinase)